MTTSLTWGKRLTAAAGVTALVAAGAVGTAFAANPGEIDGGRTTTLHITKYETTDVNEVKLGKQTGKQQTVSGKTPLAGITFTATPICYDADGAESASSFKQIDLTSADDWAAIKDFDSVSKLTTALQSDSAHWKKCDSGALTLKTGDGGTASAQTAKTLYLVQETKNESGKKISTPTPDFMVTMPLANTDTKDSATEPWLYDVYVYPKNAASAIPTKSLDATNIGDVASSSDTAQWTITATLPAYATTKATKFTEVWIKDALPAGLSYPTDGDVTSAVTEVKKDGAALSASDYTVTEDPTGTIKVALADASSAKPGNVLTVVIKTKVDQTVANIKNSATLHTKSDDPEDPGTDTTTDPKTDPVTQTGTFKITKTRKGQADSLLSGAEFKICVADDTGKACKTADTYLKESGASADKVFTTGSNGTVTGTLNIYTGAADKAPAAGKTFCAVETKAPAGYAIDATPQCFTLTTANTTAKPEELTITNEVSKVFVNAGLPVTGANGLVLLTVGGAALVLLGVGSVMVIRRRQMED